MATMFRRMKEILFCLLLAGVAYPAGDPAQPKPEALNAWEQMRFGMFIHWDAYSEAGGMWAGKKIRGLGEQIQRAARVPNQEYEG